MKTSDKKNELFEGYDINYIRSLLDIVRIDVQNNNPIGTDNYLTVALKACEKFNEELDRETFDNKRGEKDD